MDRKFVLPQPESISISGEAVRKIISSGNGDAAITYLYILLNGGSMSLSEAEKDLGLGARALEASMKALSGMGLVSSGGAEDNDSHEPAAPRKEVIPEPMESDLPEYTAADIKRELNKKGSDFSSMIAEVQRRLGKIMNSNDLVILFGIYDHLGMQPEVILMLLGHCIEDYSIRFGEGRKPTVRAIEKKAYQWARMGIVTLEEAVEHLKKEDERKTQEAEIKKALQIKNRELTPTEEKYISSWLEMGYEAKTLALAYDKTVVQTGSLVWKYMDKIVKSWHEKKLYTVEDITAGDKKKPVSKAAGDPAEKGPDSGDIERMKKYLDRIKGG